MLTLLWLDWETWWCRSELPTSISTSWSMWSLLERSTTSAGDYLEKWTTDGEARQHWRWMMPSLSQLSAEFSLAKSIKHKLNQLLIPNLIECHKLLLQEANIYSISLNVPNHCQGMENFTKSAQDLSAGWMSQEPWRFAGCQCQSLWYVHHIVCKGWKIFWQRINSYCFTHLRFPARQRTRPWQTRRQSWPLSTSKPWRLTTHSVLWLKVSEK